MVSIQFDDAWADQYAARSLLASHHLHATFFVNSGLLGAGNGRMTWNQLRGLASDGNEIGGHTVLHAHLLGKRDAPLGRGGTDEAMREICDDRANLLRAGLRATDFAYPYGQVDGTLEAIARHCGYNSARTDMSAVSRWVSRACGGESMPPADAYATRTLESFGRPTTVQAVERAVTQAHRHRCKWLQVVFHHICDGCNRYSVTPADFASLLDWLSAARSRNIVVATVHDVIGGPVRRAVGGPQPVNPPGRNLLRDPSLEQDANDDGAPDCWDAFAFGANRSTWRRTTDAHAGRYAERLEVASYANGNPQLISHQDLGQCAPTVQPGHTYTVGVYYEASRPVDFFVYRRDRTGAWSWWVGSSGLPPSASWSHASFTTPPVPRGTTSISVGLALRQVGSLTSDDYSLVDNGRGGG